MKSHIIIILGLIVVISGLVTLNFFFQQSLQMEIAEQFNKQQLLLSRSIADNIQAFIHHEQEELLLISHLLSETDIRSDSDVSRIEEKLKSVRREPIDAKLGVINMRGDLLFLDGHPNMVAEHIPDILKKAGSVKSSIAGVLETSSVVYVISPVYRQNKPVYVAFLWTRIDDIAQNLSCFKAGAKDYAWMIDKSGKLLYHPVQPGMMGKNLYKADPTCFKCHMNFDLEKRIIEGKADNFGRYIAPSGQDKIIAFSAIPNEEIPWIVAVSSPYSEVTRTTKHSMELYSYLIISIFISTSIVSLALIIFNKNRIKAEAVARRGEELEHYAVELEERVNERTGELSSEKEKLNTILGAIGGGIVLVSTEGRIQWANQMIRDMAGIDVIGKTCEDFCQDCCLPEDYVGDHIDTVILSNLFGQKGKYFQVTTAPVKGDDGELHGYIRLIQDVTEIKKMEEQIIHSEKLAAIGRLAAGIAHEIGNPLTSIFSFVQILKEMEEDDQFKKESLETISFHINRISEILKQLSGFTKMPVGESKLRSMNEIIETSINLIHYDKKAKDVLFVKELSPDLPDILVEANHLSQVFVNLMLNAVDAMPEGGTLTVRSFLSDGSVAVQFQDTGIGIEKDELNKIFDPFYTTKEKGTGLGLAVSYNIIKKMNGTLSVESSKDKGTTFTILLPLEKS
jgi:C4-dicarboxylate-specific signal transduction histidine kinase